MAKLKTNKSIQSRLKTTGTGKLIRRATNQSHFNAKTSGKQRRLKHRTSSLANQDAKAVRHYLPRK
ncbi:MAG: 50S ribosomal protein L35 [Candidatus Azambacteria bacterium]|nr:50S ribosomal protein L35 [Candidatus Azambacteria bacterium]